MYSERNNTLYELQTIKNILKKIRDYYQKIYYKIIRIVDNISNKGPEYQEYFGLEYRKIDMENEEDEYFPFAYLLIEQIILNFEDISLKYKERYNKIKEEIEEDEYIRFPRENKYYAELLLDILEEAIFPQIQVYIDPLPTKLIDDYVLSERFTQIASIKKSEKIDFIMYQVLGPKSYVYKKLLIKYSKLGLLNMTMEEANNVDGYQQSEYPIGHILSNYINVRPIRRYVQKDIGSLVPLRTIFSIDPLYRGREGELYIEQEINFN